MGGVGYWRYVECPSIGSMFSIGHVRAMLVGSIITHIALDTVPVRLDEIPDGSVIPSWEDETEFVHDMRESSPGFSRVS